MSAYAHDAPSSLGAAVPSKLRPVVLPTADVISALASTLSPRALVLQPADGQYERYRAPSQDLSNKAQPPLILVAGCTSDVAKVVRWCRRHTLPMTVASGRHTPFSISAFAVQLNLEHMRAVHVDLQARTVTAQGGARNADVDAETTHYHLATPMGAVGSTGMGLALGGGNGYGTRAWGFTCDNIIRAQLVTADGTVMECSEEQNPELLVGLRGAGFNFGVVTSLTLRLHPVGHRVKPELSADDEAIAVSHSLPSQQELQGMVVMLMKAFPAPAAKAGLATMSRVSHGSALISRDLFFEANLVWTPNGPIFAVVCGYLGTDVYEGHRLSHELSRRLTADIAPELPVLMKDCKTLPYFALQQRTGGLVPPGNWMERSVVFDDISPELAGIIHDRFVSAPPAARRTVVPCIAWNARGRAQDVDPASSSVSAAKRASSFWMLLLTPYELEGEAEARQWQSDLRKALEPFSTANVANVIQAPAEADEVYRELMPRLKALKQKYDPTNFFSFNNNIAP